MQDTTTDAELVARHLAGDRSALAAIYDRYADSLHDTAAAMTRQRHDAADVLQDVFVTAAERMGQLRDPAKLKPWLFAILRNEVYRRTGRKRRTVVTDFTDPVAEMTAPSQPADEGSSVEFEELATLVRGAAAGLDERDQLVLELSVRQGLQGEDLAAALGVSAQQSYGMVHRMRQRTERSLGAYCVARTGRKDCPELAEILRDWDGEFSVLVRKRVARHVDDCEVCERSRRTLAPFALFGAAPVMAAPLELRDRILGAAAGPHPAPPYGFEASGGFPSVVKYGRRFGLWMLMTASFLFLGLGTTVFVLADDDSIAIDAGTTTTLDAPATTSETTQTTNASTTTESDDPASRTTADSTASSVIPTAPVTTVVGTTIPSLTTLPTPSTSAPPTTAPATTTPATTSPVTTSPVTTTPVTTTPVTTTPATTTPATTTPATTTPPAPGSLGVSAGAVDFGRTVAETVVVLSNTGGQPVEWSGSLGPPAFNTASTPFSFQPSAGTLAAGSQVQIVVRIDRTWPTEGPVTARRIVFSAAGTSAAVELRGTIARPPVIRPIDVPPVCEAAVGNGLLWNVAITDESEPITARIVVVRPDGAVVSQPFVQDIGQWFAFISFGDLSTGQHAWTVEATDALGNRGVLTGSTTIAPIGGSC